MARTAIACLCAAALTAGMAGCGSSSPAAPPSKAAIFRSEHAHTMTPYGMIDPGSAQDTADGRVTYQTADGSHWIVTMDEQADGTYRYGEPSRVGPASQ